MALSAAHLKRYRGIILTLVNINHRNQNARLDHITLAMVMRGAGCSVGENDVLTLLQDLCDRGFIRYEQKVNKLTNDIEIQKIEITPGGRDILENTTSDPAVEV